MGAICSYLRATHLDSAIRVIGFLDSEPAIATKEVMQQPPAIQSEERSTETMESPFDDSAQAHFDTASESGSDSDSDMEELRGKRSNRRPPINNFTQQRLKAVNPVFTLKTVAPILLFLGIFLVPLGAAMWLAAHYVQDVSIEYTQCELLASNESWTPIPDKFVRYRYKNTKFADVTTAQWKLSVDDTQEDADEKNVCQIQFLVPHKIKGPLYFFYRLENFHQNHRRYAKSYSEDQLNGEAASINDIKDTAGLNCQPLSVNEDGQIYYPCGLIANSFFNDTFSSTLTAVNGSSSDYAMTNEGIAWSHNDRRFKKTKYNYKDIAPPPNWVKRYPNGYNSTNVPDILTWGEFQNWMFTSAFADFQKLVLRNDDDAIEAGTYQVSVGLHFPVLPYKGKKHISLSQRSPIGGKNYFLGFSWIVCGGICFVLAILALIINALRPHRMGDESLLSWKRDENAPQSASGTS